MRPIIAGEPGETWTNETGKVRWQFIASLMNTCGLCIQFHRQVGPHWPIPLHRSCRCQQIPIYPGDTAHPFVDFREVIDELPADQRDRVVGKGALRLIESGVVKWDDVVTRGRIRTLREVIAREALTAPRLIRAGFAKARARTAVEAAHPEESLAADRSAKLLASLLQGRGFSPAEILKHTGERLAARVGVQLRTDGPLMVATRPRATLLPAIAAPAYGLAMRPTDPATAIRPEDARRLIGFAVGDEAAARDGDLPGTVGELDALLLELGSKVDHDALRAMLKRLGVD